MTKIYFVRHAEPIHSWKDDRTRPLTEGGMNDSKKVTDFLKTINVNCFYSSPYKRSLETIYEGSVFHGLSITLDERLRERQSGIGGNKSRIEGNHGMFQKRWNDFDYCEEGGESLGVVQKRNMAAIFEILANEKKVIL
jgi:2,3-bisphosphoglycerate-dependent phosphoglycerate mutase